MNEKIESLKKTFNEGLDLLKEQKVDEAIAKMAEVAPILKELEDGEDETIQKITKSEDEVKKTADLLTSSQETITKQAEQLQKYADLFVSAEDLKALIEDLKSGQEMVKTLETKVDALEKTASSRQLNGAPVVKTAHEILAEVKLS